VPRYYIECTEDRAVHPGLQGSMVAASPCRQVYSMPTGHSPFFSAPRALAAILERIAATA